MLWKGVALTAKEDFAAAMVQLKDKEDATQFRALFAHVFPKQTDALLGYLVGDCPPEQQHRVCELLEVNRPFEGSTRELFFIGFHLPIVNPELAALIEAIPRRDWSPFWNE